MEIWPDAVPARIEKLKDEQDPRALLNERLFFFIHSIESETLDRRGICQGAGDDTGPGIEHNIRDIKAIGGRGWARTGRAENRESGRSKWFHLFLNCISVKKTIYCLECKTYDIENIGTAQRSFYFSPSDEFKVIYDAPHFILSFEIYVAGEKGTKHIYKCRHYKILSIESLSLDVKYEFNSDNKRMYSGKDGTIILDEREIE